MVKNKEITSSEAYKTSNGARQTRCGQMRPQKPTIYFKNNNNNKFNHKVTAITNQSCTS